MQYLLLSQAGEQIPHEALDVAIQTLVAVTDSDQELIPPVKVCSGVISDGRDLADQVRTIMGARVPVRRSSVPFATLKSQGSASKFVKSTAMPLRIGQARSSPRSIFGTGSSWRAPSWRRDHENLGSHRRIETAVSTARACTLTPFSSAAHRRPSQWNHPREVV